MRLWHKSIISKLPRQQLLGQHRECAALRGLGWGRKHATVNYVFDHPYQLLYWYHCSVMWEMKKRGYKVDRKWLNVLYRGKRCQYATSEFVGKTDLRAYPEHDGAYLKECLDNLKEKGITINMENGND